MSDANQEPTMEEILASIRRIISEDEAPAEEAAEAAPEAAPEPEPVAERLVAETPADMALDEEDDVLELTDRVSPEPDVETHGDLDVYRAREPEPPSYREEAPAWTPSASDDEHLVSGSVAAEAASAFGQLSRRIGMPASDRTLEDVVREMLRPLLKEWLDTNLPEIVQAKVDAEVERIARGRVR